jgi:hypothetical protein
MLKRDSFERVKFFQKTFGNFRKNYKPPKPHIPPVSFSSKQYL